MVPVSVEPYQFGAVRCLRRSPGPQSCSGLSEGLGLRAQGLLQDGTVFGLGGPAEARGPLLEGLDETVVEIADDKLAHEASPRCYQMMIAILGGWFKGSGGEFLVTGIRVVYARDVIQGAAG
jgi:hypothetical protein